MDPTRLEPDIPNQTTSLLSFDHDPNPPSKPSKPSKPTLIIILVTSSFLTLAFGIFLGYALHSTPNPAPIPQPRRALTKLKNPSVILISSDGFRFGYQFKSPTPNIHRLIANGTEAESGLIPVFPTLTFPNHYSIVTGLYPCYHGIINNYFTDPLTNDKFTMSNHDPKWWIGEPLWETVAKQNMTAATYFWPGSEVKRTGWDCPVKYCQQYNQSVPFQDRVDTVLSYFDNADTGADVPSFLTLYFEDPDHQGHQVGPDDPQITDAIANIDAMIGRLIQGLEKRGVFEDVTILMLGDHGMVGTCDKKLLFLEDLSPWVEIPTHWVQSYTPLLAIRPTEGVSPKDVVAKINEGLQSGKVENGDKLTVYLKEDLPSRLHYADSYRIPPIIGLVQEGFKVEMKRTGKQECGGAHGYDNAFFSMRTIFIAHGPQFARGRKVPSFENVQIYNLVTSILGIEGTANNGSLAFPQSVLLPEQ
ncbi:hypothetical protein vseg_000717 [Gypsophila vaccaria]